MSKKNKIDFEPPHDGFFTSSVASVNETTGYAVTVPDTQEEADAVSLVGNTEFTQGKKDGQANSKKRKK